ncbi:MAG: phenylacetate--CoA ligase [Alphaproteobacteria bacterium]|nr:phenylacetate--CoA ligase [Alphaproteobacteria bacterium]
MSGHYDVLETRDAEARETALMAALPGQVAHAKSATDHYAEVLAAVDPHAVTSRAALAKLPVTRKSSVPAMQKARPPFGGLLPRHARLVRIFQSPGPIYEPETDQADFWGYGRGFYAAGFREGDLIHNTFAYHLTPAGRMVESGARAVGCPVIPAGTGNTEQQLKVIADLRPSGYCGTPSFLKILLERARETGADTSSLEHASVGGEALPPALRKVLGELGMKTVLQGYATAELGLIAYESPALEGMIVNENIVVEILHPATGDPVTAGEVGEVVVTLLKPDYPLLRFATGDLSAVLPGTSPCGRTNMRLRGWMGRADQTTKVKGMFVMPTMIAEIQRRHPEILKARLVVTTVDNLDAMTLRCEVAPGTAGIEHRIGDSLQSVCKLRGKIELVAPGSLPNDFKAIEDARKYD